jgi:hypothetical protein
LSRGTRIKVRTKAKNKSKATIAKKEVKNRLGMSKVSTEARCKETMARSRPSMNRARSEVKSMPTMARSRPTKSRPMFTLNLEYA